MDTPKRDANTTSPIFSDFIDNIGEDADAPKKAAETVRDLIDLSGLAEAQRSVAIRVMMMVNNVNMVKSPFVFCVGLHAGQTGLS